jgi:23S rRNA (pseudouridine1915-N3)-methyltransferase
MKITLLVIGKTDQSFINEGFVFYENRLKHYISFEIKVIPDVKISKNLTRDQLKDKEGVLIMNYLKSEDAVILLDEKGKEFTSLEFAQIIEKKMIKGLKNLVFVIGGAYGISNHLKNYEKISLSKLTFSHQLVRLVFIEQLYRAMTILKGEPYHHE